MISGGCSFAKANWAPGGRSAVLFQLGGSVNRLQKLAPSRRQSQLPFPSRAAMQQNVDSAGSGGKGRVYDPGRQDQLGRERSDGRLAIHLEL